MKRTFSILLAFFVVCLSLILLAGCKKDCSVENITKERQLLVERQHSYQEGIHNSVKRNYSIEVAVDVPVKGTEQLMDALTDFLNESLYVAYESASNFYSPEDVVFFHSQVYTEDLSNLLDSYVDSYINIDAEKSKETVKEVVENMFNLNLFLIAQTESFVTYGLEWCLRGESCSSEYHCYTFSKEDGHLLDSVVNVKEMQHYVKNHVQEYMPSEKVQLADADFEDTFEFALLEKGLLIVNNFALDHYSVTLSDYDKVQSLLSSEAQELVEKMGDSTQNNRQEYFVGDRLGNVTSWVEEKNIILTQTPSLYKWQGNFFENGDDYAWSSRGDHPTLRAFFVGKGMGEPAPIIDGKSVVYAHWDEIHTTNPTGQAFAFNPVANTLYLPSVENMMMGKHDCFDKYEVYQFNQFEFVHSGTEGGFWLHPSLRQFGRLCYAGKVRNDVVRIDEMRIYDERRYDAQYDDARIDTCRYRYAVWKNKDNMQSAPDLVIYNGYYSPEKGGYVFEYDGRQYVVARDLPAGNKVIYCVSEVRGGKIS